MKHIVYLLSLFLFVLSGGGMFFELSRNVLTVITLLLITMYIFIYQRKISNVNSVIILRVFFIINVMFIINFIFAIPGQSINTYMYMFLTILLALVFQISLSRVEFLNYFYKILEIIKIHAFFTFFAYFFLKGQLSMITIEQGAMYSSFNYIFYYLEEIGKISLAGFEFVRNQGLFWEPGILQIFLNILLFLQFFVFQTSKRKIATTIFIILTTFSTAGFLIMLIQILYKVKSLLSLKNFLYILPLSAILLLVFYPLIEANLTDKLVGDNATSSFVRFFDALQSLVIISDYPLTGIGITIESYFKLQTEKYYDVFGIFSYLPTGNTNSILGTLVFLGVPFGASFLYFLYHQSIVTVNKNLFFIMMLIALSSEPLLLRPFFFFLIFNGFVNVMSKKYSNNRRYSLNVPTNEQYKKIEV